MNFSKISAICVLATTTACSEPQLSSPIEDQLAWFNSHKADFLPTFFGCKKDLLVTSNDMTPKQDKEVKACVQTRLGDLALKDGIYYNIDEVNQYKQSLKKG